MTKSISLLPDLYLLLYYVTKYVLYYILMHYLKKKSLLSGDHGVISASHKDSISTYCFCVTSSINALLQVKNRSVLPVDHVGRRRQRPAVGESFFNVRCVSSLSVVCGGDLRPRRATNQSGERGARREEGAKGDGDGGGGKEEVRWVDLVTPESQMGLGAPGDVRVPL